MLVSVADAVLYSVVFGKRSTKRHPRLCRLTSCRLACRALSLDCLLCATDYLIDTTIFQRNETKRAQVPEQHAVSSWDSVAQAMLVIAAKAEGALPPPAGAVAGSGNPQVLLLAGLELTNAQRQTTDRVHTAVTADFALRRRMLLRRCDVTVQSFLRGKQRVGSVGAVVDLPPVLKVGKGEWGGGGVPPVLQAVDFNIFQYC